jgi:hypothetical protein
MTSAPTVPAVVRHPTGGWTHAHPDQARPHVRIYRGWWSKKFLASQALPAAAIERRTAA